MFSGAEVVTELKDEAKAARLLGQRHYEHCWCCAEKAFRWADANFCHLVIHQMSVEGSFNIIDYNKINASVERKESRLLWRSNIVCDQFQKLVEGISGADVRKEEVAEQARKKQKQKEKESASASEALSKWLKPATAERKAKAAKKPAGE